MTTIEDIGWNEYKKTLPAEQQIDADVVARVIAENKTNYKLLSKQGERLGVLRGKAHLTLSKDALPKVGDWVVFSNEGEDAVVAIETILPRLTKLSRHGAGRVDEEQVLVTNIDTVFIMQALDGNFNLNRLERYLVMVENSGAVPIIILNKTDLIDDANEYTEQVKTLAPNVSALPLSALAGKDIDAIKEYLLPHSTSVFVGSSGVGKSTLLNALLGLELQETQGLRDDDQGRHTTTRRELFVLPNGAIIIDTPGMRELSVKGMESIEDTFAEVESLTTECAFRNCTHESTEGCALQQAVDKGELSQKQFDNYLKIRREQEFEESKVDKQHRAARTARVKKTQKGYKQILREKYQSKEFTGDE